MSNRAGGAALRLTLAWVLLVGAGLDRAAGQEPARSAGMITPAADRVIARGLDYLARNQHDNGAYGSNSYRGNVAVTALAGLAFLSSGSTPGMGPYGGHIDRLTDYLLKNTKASGFMVVQEATSHGPMYDHGFGTLYLAEVYGMTQRTDVREKLKKAVQLLVVTQNDQGGWRYLPKQTAGDDLSVTVCQIMALRAARNAGIFVPSSTVERCTKYVRQCQNPDGGFRYMLPPGPSIFPRSAGGVVALYSAGIYEGAEIDAGLSYIMSHMPGQRIRRESHYFYGHYYAVQAMHQAGGDYWDRWYPAIRQELIAHAMNDGSWSDPVCNEYGTAMALIILQLPNNYLPIFQR